MDEFLLWPVSYILKLQLKETNYRNDSELGFSGYER